MMKLALACLFWEGRAMAEMRQENVPSYTCELGAQGLVGLNPGCCMSIKYADSFCQARDDIKLLEVDDAILHQILNQRVTIRGSSSDEEAVLCTSSKTFAIKFVATSNSVFLFPPPPEQGPEQVPDFTNSGSSCSATTIMASGHMELVQIAPRLDKLKTLVGKRPLREDEEEDYVYGHEGLYSFKDLLNQIQASEGELREGLAHLQAVEMEGFWRIVDDKYMGSLLDLMVLSSVQHGWDIRALRAADAVTVLGTHGYPRKIVEHCLQMYGKNIGSQAADTGETKEEQVFCLDERLLCLRYAKQLLNSGKWKLDDFMEAWSQSLPCSELHPTKEMLKGEALCEQIGADIWVRPFSVSTLPANPADLFAALFKKRKRWNWEDLEPYIRDLKVPGVSVEGLLIKYTRRTQPTADATPIFSAR